MLRSLILGGGFSQQTIIVLMSSVFVVFCTMPIHEFAHAFVATKLGDPTPRLQGRLTLNPFAHIDLIGALMILIVGFGYAKPVPVNIRNFKNRKVGMGLTAAAGPAANLIMAFVFLTLYAISYYNGTEFAQIVGLFFYYAAYINTSLAVFNLIPIPPLDGSRILAIIIPNKYYYQIMQYERYIMIGVMILLFTGILNTPLSFLVQKVFNGILYIVSNLFSLFM